MSDVRYSINGKYFQDYGVGVSASLGIADTLKRKPVNKYDWSEYHGLSLDLSKPKFQERGIELLCFIVGDNWQDLFDKFNTMIRDEFSKSGTQRLLIEPFGHKAMPYEVFMMEEVKVSKVFKDCQMVAVFSLNMIEPNPIKKIYKTDATDNYFLFQTATWATVFWGDSLENVRGNVDINRNYSLAPEKDRVKVDYKIWGIFHKMEVFTPNVYHFFTKAKFPTPGIKTMYLVGKHPDKTYTILDEVSVTVGVGFSSFDIAFACTPTDYERFFLKMSEECEMKDTSVYTTDWVPTATDGYIVIAGNISEFSPVITNATLIWEKL